MLCDDERESAACYAQRIQSSILPEWPLELLVEWLYRHNAQIGKYAFLGFEKLAFKKETWKLEQIPDRLCFDNPAFCDEIIADLNNYPTPQDWVAKYIADNGTWSTPIVLFDNRRAFDGSRLVNEMKYPFHLIEGHHRLGYLIGLWEKFALSQTHVVWLATFAERFNHNAK